MSTVIPSSAPPSRAVLARTKVRWQELSQGLSLVTLGYLSLFALVLPGLAFVWLFDHAGRVGLPLDRQQLEAAFYLGVLLLGAGAFLGCGLLVAGKWRCLVHAPQFHGGRAWMLACALSLLLGSFLALGAQLVHGAQRHGLFQKELGRLGDPELFRTGGPVQLAGAALGMTGVLLFSQFLRAIAGCFAMRGLAKRIEGFLVLACVVSGGSIGVALCYDRLPFRAEVVQAVGAAWLAFFLGHYLLILGARRCIDTALRHLGANELPPHSRYDSKAGPAKPHSGLHEFYSARLP
jgi:hypothetical protein